MESKKLRIDRDARAVVFDDNGKTSFLLFLDREHHWKIPGGLMSGSEDEVNYALREFLNRMNLRKVEVIPNTEYRGRYDFTRNYNTLVDLPLSARAIRGDSTAQLEIGRNYIKSIWVPYSIVLRLLRNSPEQKKALDSVCTSANLNVAYL